MLNKLKNIFKSDFAKNVLTLSVGTTLAQAIPVAISPILTRLYTPEDFGVLALFMAIVAILGSIVNAKYEMAILLPKEDKDAYALVKLSFLISFGISVLTLIAVFIFKEKIAYSLEQPSVENWLFLVPISILLIGGYNSLNIFNNRVKNYRNIAKSSVSKSTSLAITQVGIGLLKVGTGGLILGQLASYIGGNGVLIRGIRIHMPFIYNTQFIKLKTVAKRYNKFPKFTLPAALLNSTNLNITSFLISGIFSVQTLGFYSLASRVLGGPSLVLGQSIGQVYFQKATSLRANSHSIKPVFLKSLKKLLIVSIPFFGLLSFVVEPIFDIVFGPDWVSAGTISKVLIPLVFIRFIVSALSSTTTTLEKQEFDLLVNIFLLSGSIAVFALYRDLEAIKLITLYVKVLTGLYLGILLVFYLLIINDDQKNKNI